MNLWVLQFPPFQSQGLAVLPELLAYVIDLTLWFAFHKFCQWNVRFHPRNQSSYRSIRIILLLIYRALLHLNVGITVLRIKNNCSSPCYMVISLISIFNNLQFSTVISGNFPYIYFLVDLYFACRVCCCDEVTSTHCNGRCSFLID